MAPSGIFKKLGFPSFKNLRTISRSFDYFMPIFFHNFPGKKFMEKKFQDKNFSARKISMTKNSQPIFLPIFFVFSIFQDFLKLPEIFFLNFLKFRKNVRILLFFLYSVQADR